MGLKIRGFMFWDIADEGIVPVGKEKELWLASGLNKFMRTRIRILHKKSKYMYSCGLKKDKIINFFVINIKLYRKIGIFC